jgi:alpha-L-fucosidase
MMTYTKDTHAPAKVYAPTALDVDGWVRVARDGGMKYAVLTTKHRMGFCLWDSKVTVHGKEFDYDVAASGNTTDVVQAFMAACRKYGIVPGLYYNLRDYHSGSGGSGKSEEGLSKDFFDQVKGQLTELTTRNPDCHYYWIDHPSSANAQQLADIYELLRRADPRNVVQFNRHLAKPWGGSWKNPGINVFDKAKGYGFPTDVIGSENRKPDGPVSKFQSWQGRQYFVGYEHCAMLAGSWFDSDPKQIPRSTKGIFDTYQTIRNFGGNLLLDIGPDKQGRIDEKFAKFLIELKAQIEPFEAALAKSKH